MDAETKAALYDIQLACQLIIDFVKGNTFSDYQSSPMMKSAVERQFITIGEALNRAIRQSPELNQQITDTRRIINFRNVLTHGYSSISDAVVWEVVQSGLPRLFEETAALLGDVEKD